MSNKFTIYKVEVELLRLRGGNTRFQNVGYFSTKEKAKQAADKAVRRYYELYGSEKNRNYDIHPNGDYLITNQPYISEITVM